MPLPERIANITRLLSEKGSSTFKDLLEPTQGKLGVVVSFVAVLELIKRGLVGLSEYSDDFDDESADNYALQTTEKRAKNTLPSIDNTGHAIGEQTLYWLH